MRGNDGHRTDVHIGNFIYMVGRCKQEANFNLFISYCTMWDVVGYTILVKPQTICTIFVGVYNILNEYIMY